MIPKWHKIIPFFPKKRTFCNEKKKVHINQQLLHSDTSDGNVFPIIYEVGLLLYNYYNLYEIEL